MSGNGLTPEELLAESATALPDKEVVSILDLNADVDVALDAASPIDLAAAANLNVAAPIQAAAGANVLSSGSDAAATVTHSDGGGTLINQGMNQVTADAFAVQDSAIDQSDAGIGDDGTGTDTGTGGDTDTGATVDTSTGALLDGSLLNVNVDVDLDADLAAPIGGAVAANANVAAPINAGVAANIGSIDSTANAISVQDATINQTMADVHATANADQTSSISQGTGDTGAGTTGGTSAGTSTGDTGGTSDGASGTSSGGAAG